MIWKSCSTLIGCSGHEQIEMPSIGLEFFRNRQVASLQLTNSAFGHDGSLDVRSVSPVSAISRVSPEHIDLKDVDVCGLKN